MFSCKILPFLIFHAVPCSRNRSYACFIDVNAWTVATEIFPSHLRPQGTAIGISTLFLTDLLWLMLAPTASATIGWKYYIVFIALTLVHLVYFWFRLPEVSSSSPGPIRDLT